VEKNDTSFVQSKTLYGILYFMKCSILIYKTKSYGHKNGWKSAGAGVYLRAWKIMPRGVDILKRKDGLYD